MSDLTERLAAKLAWITPLNQLTAIDAAHILPLLLSEPELVAGLAPEVKREVLRQLLQERLASPESFAVRWSRIIELEADCDPTINEEALVNLLAPEVTP